MGVPSWIDDLGHALPASVHRLVPFAVRADLRTRWGWTRPGDLTYHVAPPSVAPGRTVGPPDVIVVGSEAGESRRLFHELARHPGVADPVDVDGSSHFFADGCTAACGPDRLASFQRWFPRGAGELALHWSPDGLAYEWETELLADAAPEAHWVVLLRDPIDRLLSGLKSSRDERKAHVGAYLADAVERSMYGRQLERLRRRVPRQRVHVATAEAWEADSGAIWAGIDEQLGLDAGRRSAPHAPRVRPRIPVAADVRVTLGELFASDVALLEELHPELDLSVWPHRTAFVADRPVG